MDGPNLYTYVMNRPLSKVDPTGKAEAAPSSDKPLDFTTFWRLYEDAVGHPAFNEALALWRKYTPAKPPEVTVGPQTGPVDRTDLAQRYVQTRSNFNRSPILAGIGQIIAEKISKDPRAVDKASDIAANVGAMADAVGYQQLQKAELKPDSARPVQILSRAGRAPTD